MIAYDDSNLRKLLFELEPKRRMQAVKGAFRKAASKVKKQAASNLRSSGLQVRKGMEKGIRQVVYKRTPGFRVTIGTKKANAKTGKGESGMHVNRRGLKKPILLWAEGGTKSRSTKSRRGKCGRGRKGHPTGSMPSSRFMEKTRAQMKGSVTDELHDAMEQSIIKTARKYGCK